MNFNFSCCKVVFMWKKWNSKVCEDCFHHFLEKLIIRFFGIGTNIYSDKIYDRSTGWTQLSRAIGIWNYPWLLQIAKYWKRCRKEDILNNLPLSNGTVSTAKRRKTWGTAEVAQIHRLGHCVKTTFEQEGKCTGSGTDEWHRIKNLYCCGRNQVKQPLADVKNESVSPRPEGKQVVVRGRTQQWVTRKEFFIVWEFKVHRKNNVKLETEGAQI